MSSGCEFVCKNSECKNFNTGITITAPWPMGDIDKVMESSRVKENKEALETYKKLKEQGRKHACIALPDNDDIPVLAYRINKWCDKCPSIQTFDAMVKENHTIEEIIEEANIPSNCPACNTKMKTLSELLDQETGGINCPSCNVKLKTHTWLSNQKE